MMRSLLLGLGLLTLGACSACSQTPPPIDARAAEKVDTARATAELSIRRESCEDGRSYGPNCGLVMRHTATEEFLTLFDQKVCAELSDEDCEAALQRLIDSELAQRYSAANQKAVEVGCQLHPGTCDDGEAYERMLLASHNAHVRKDLSFEEYQIEEERLAEHRAADGADVTTTAAVIGLVAAVATGGRICHSYPSIFGGTLTACPR